MTETPAQLPELRLKRGEDRRLSRRPPVGVFQRSRHGAHAAAELSRPARCAASSRDRDKFLGYAYVNPHSLICARILGRDPQHPPSKSLIVHRLQVAQSLRRSLYDAAVLPAGVRRIRWLARAGARSLRRRHRRPDRDGGHGGAASADVEAAVRKAIAPAALLWKNDAGARELEGLPSLRRDGVRRTARIRRGGGGRRRISQCRWAAGRRPAGSSTRPRTGWPCANTSAARACSMSSATSAPGARCAASRRHRSRPASIHRRRRWKRLQATAAANGLKPRDDSRATPSTCMEKLHARAGAASMSS